MNHAHHVGAGRALPACALKLDSHHARISADSQRGNAVRVPIKVDYGVRALLELAYSTDGEPVPTSVIAARQHMPEPYLDQVLAILNRRGFVRSRRGPQGGHMLAKDPSEITLMMVTETLEGHTPPLECITDPYECSLSGACAQRAVWQSVEEAIDRVLSSTTIADLVTQQRGLDPKVEAKAETL